MKVGDAYVAGRSPDNARALLAAADRLGLDPAVVRTTDGGYLVPEELVDELGNTPGVPVDAGIEQEKHVPASVGDEAEIDEPPLGVGENLDKPNLKPESSEHQFDLNSATYPRLRAEAARRGLVSTGTAAEVRARLRHDIEGE